jgi:hypothetical protein
VSIAEFRRLAIEQIEANETKMLDALTKHQFVQNNVVDGVYTPHVGAEQIGLQVIEQTAKLRTLGLAREILNDVFRRMTSPSQSDKERKPEERGALY